MLGFIHRSTAISTWANLRQGANIPIEQALGAFDLFMSVGTHDLDWVSDTLRDPQILVQPVLI